MKRALALTAAAALFFPLTALAQTSLLSALLGIGAPVASAPAASRVDLLFDADSYTPPFYRGRSLPSPGSTLHLEAIPHFGRGAGADSSIVYTWRVNGQVVGSVSGAGRSAVVLPSPQLFGSDTISVTATTADGTETGTASISLPSVDPFVVLYEDHPLFGIEYFAAVSPSYPVHDADMTFVAVPYFAAIKSRNDPSLSYDWRVNGISPEGTSALPSEITIDASRAPGLIGIDLALTSAQNVLLDAIGSWTVLFSAPPSSFASPSAASSQNVFRTGAAH